jgi:serine protease Do
MKGRYHKRFMVSVFVMTLIIMVAGTPAGCSSKKDSMEVVGFPQSFVELAEKVKPSVVNISTTKTVKIPGNPFRHFFGPGREDQFGDFFGRFFGDVPDRELKQKSLGSGFIIDKDGYIVTNNHVVEGADEIKVKFADGRELKAKVIGRDRKTDIALIKISSAFENLQALSLGDSENVQVGQWVLAVGNPFGLGNTVTQGIISATGRVIGAGPYDNFLQTDAPINPGNSGGPLINLKGEAIGICTAIVAGGQGIGFAIPINMAKSMVPQLKEKGKFVRGWIGVSIQTITPEIAQGLGVKETTGALVADVVPEGPAAAAGMARGDIIVSFDGKDIRNISDLSRMVAATQVGKTVAVKIMRSGKETELKLTVAEMAEEKAGVRKSGMETDLGIAVEEITPQLQNQFGIKDRRGVVIVEVASGSPADMAGLQAGDVIKEMNRKAVGNLNDYEKAMARAQKGKPVLLLIKRGGQTLYVTIGGS